MRTSSGKKSNARPFPEQAHQRPWPVKAVGLLLLLQAMGLFALGGMHVAAEYALEQGLLQDLLHWNGLQTLIEILPSRLQTWWIVSLSWGRKELPLKMASGAFVNVGLIYVALSILAVVTAIGFLRMRRNAWTYAMLLQGLCLFIALILYLRGKPIYIYAVMLYAIGMVLYLNYHDVRGAFRPKPQVGQEHRSAKRSGGVP